MQPLTIIFIGPQGSGKGTQIEMLKTRLQEQFPEQSITHIQTGKPFRELAEKGGYTAHVVKGLLEKGTLVPDVLTSAFVVQEFVQQHEANAHILFDGYPRDIEQAKTCEELFKLYDREKVHIVYLDTPETVVTERMLKRGRSDDTEAVIAERLRQYKNVTEPLISYYEERPQTEVHRVKGDGSIEEVQQEILEALKLS